MKKKLAIRLPFTLLFMLLLSISAAHGSSWLYSTTSGDILDQAATSTYGIARIDFDENNNPVPKVILSND